MALVVDAGAFYALADASEPGHDAVARILTSERQALVSTELAVAEADFLILRRLGLNAEMAFLEDLVAGTFIVDCLTLQEIGAARDVVKKYGDLRLGLADASLVVLALRYHTRRILTFDERAFRAIAPLQGGNFLVLPADSD